jgi:hypothetical protein
MSVSMRKNRPRNLAAGKSDVWEVIFDLLCEVDVNHQPPAVWAAKADEAEKKIRAAIRTEKKQ